MLPDIRDPEALRAAFRWVVPRVYNLGVDACDRWAASAPDRPAILTAGSQGVTVTTYGELRRLSNRLAAALRRRGVARGDRVAVLLPQSPLVAATHLAAYKLGAVAVPLAAVFGADAVAYRLADAGITAAVTDAAGAPKLREAAREAPSLSLVVCADGPGEGAEGLAELLEAESDDFAPVPTTADDPALMIYTSGTTGLPKGALHAHRVVLGHLPGVQMHHEFLPQPGDRLWTPADWAWAGGLLDVLLPGLVLGVPVVARAHAKFDPDEAWRFMADLGVRNAFIPPTALRMLRAAPLPASRPRLRTVGSGGEALGEETLAWGREAFGLHVNEFYGQTEANLVVSSNAAIGETRPGWMGRAAPGHAVAVLRPDGTRAAPFEAGEIAVRAPDPVMFLGYWNRPEATAAKFTDGPEGARWLLTGDRGEEDGDGYLRFAGRTDDLIASAGYRIGPVEIEESLVRHPAVALAAVVGKPDVLRGEIVKAFLVLKPGHAPSDALTADIQGFVRTRLAAHEYPREIAYLDALPLTTTGKVIRRALREG